MSGRIAVAGFQHETNTFAGTPAAFEASGQANGWPGLVQGDALPPAVKGLNLPIAGFLSGGHQAVPLLWCSASPSGPVDTAAFERVAGMLCDALRRAGPLDGVYLDLHGAMVVADHDDGEGELLERVRGVVGPDLPIVASLDLHANVSPRMVALATVLVAYRSYPHVDMAGTGLRAARIMDRLLCRRDAPAAAFRQIPFLIPLVSQSTLAAPAADLYRHLAALEETPGLLSLSLAMGFPLADVPDAGPSVFGYGADAGAVARAVDDLAGAVAAAEPAFLIDVLTPDEAVTAAIEGARSARRPIVLADTQDNPGGGAAGDGVALIEALLRHGAEGAVVGLLTDPAAAAAAHAAGVGAEIELALGAGTGFGGAKPLHGRFRVLRLADGVFEATGPVYAGCRMRLGPMALLEAGGVRIAVASRKQQAADQAMFRHLGVEPAAASILVLKSSVHFRADFGPIAEAVLVVAAPGPNVADPGGLPFRWLRPGVRRRPACPVREASEVGA